MSARFKLNRRGWAAVLCAGLALAVLPRFMWAGDAAQPPQAPPIEQQFAAVSEQTTSMAVKEKLSAAAAGALLEKHINRFGEETEKLLDARLNGLKGFFEERKQGSPLYASQTLDMNAKFRAAGAVVETFFTKIGEALGAEPSSEPDSFSTYARQCFQENVLDPAKARQAMEQAIVGFRGDVAEAEGRLLVALKADIGDDVIDGGPAVLDVDAEASVLALCEALVNATVDDAIGDLGASLGMFVVSNVVGDMVAKRVTPDDASRSRRVATNLAAGVAVDAALEKGIRAAGYDPEGKVVAKVNTGIDRIRAEIIDGDPNMAEIYPTLSFFRRTHPDPAVRSACQRADETVAQAANLGLRERLRRMRNECSRRLWKALMTQLAGPDAAASPFLFYQPLAADQCSPPDQIIRWANALTNIYGGK